jgi:hypothetical protein
MALKKPESTNMITVAREPPDLKVLTNVAEFVVTFIITVSTKSLEELFDDGW